MAITADYIPKIGANGQLTGDITTSYNLATSGISTFFNKNNFNSIKGPKDTGGADINNYSNLINWGGGSYSKLKPMYDTANPIQIGDQVVYKPKKAGDPYIAVNSVGHISSQTLQGSLDDYKPLLEAGVSLGSITIKPNTSYNQLGSLSQTADPLPVYNGLGITEADKALKSIQDKITGI